MIRAAVVAVCFGSSSAFVAVQPARVSSVAVQAVPRDDAAKPLAALAPAAQLAGALTLATITIGAPEVACARSVWKLCLVLVPNAALVTGRIAQVRRDVDGADEARRRREQQEEGRPQTSGQEGARAEGQGRPEG